MSKTLLAVVLILGMATAYGQTVPKSTFTIKGQEWEYRNYAASPNTLEQRGDGEVTRFVFKVVDVKDSAGITFSHITKTGTATKNSNLAWQRDFVVRSDSRTLFLPADYYTDDTIYRCDIYNMRTKKLYMTTHITGDSIQYPLEMGENTALKRNDLYSNMAITDPLNDNEMATMHLRVQRKFKGKVIEEIREIVGMQKISTDAGEFDCIKIHIRFQLQAAGQAVDIQEYYCPGIGIIRSQDAHGNMMELIRVREKN